MENIIQRIIDIDKRAQQKYIDAQQRREKVEAEVKEEIKKMDDKTRENGESKLADLRTSENELLLETQRTIAADLAEKKKKLEQIYLENHLNWEQDLFQKVLQK